MKAERCINVMFNLVLYCFSVTVEDLNLQRRYRYEDINILRTRNFVVLDCTLDASTRLISPALSYSKWSEKNLPRDTIRPDIL